MHEVTIPLRWCQESEVASQEDYMKIIQEEYAARYLGLLGIAATPANKAAVIKNKPLEDCEIHGIWGEDSGSAIADAIKIVPPLQVRLGGEFEASVEDQQRWGHWYGHSEHIRVQPPPVCGRTIFLEDGDEEDSNSMAMFPPDRRLGDKSEIEDLQAELKRIRQGNAAAVRGDKASAAGQKGGGSGSAGQNARSSVANEIRETMRQELAGLKQKFILPFACERLGEDKSVRVTPWPATGPLDLEVPKEFVKEARQALEVSLEDVKKNTMIFVKERLPLELMTRRRDTDELKQVRDSLLETEVSRLIGLLAHLLYWLSLAKNKAAGDVRLTDAALQSMYVGVHDIWSTFERRHREYTVGVNLTLPCLMVTIKFGILRCFEVQYPTIAGDEVLCQKIVDRINGMMMRLFDPDGQYARFGKADSGGKASDVAAEWKKSIKLTKQLDRMTSYHGNATLAAKKVGRMNRCTPLVRTLLGTKNAEGMDEHKGGYVSDSRTRYMLHRSDHQAAALPADVFPDAGGEPWDGGRERQRQLMKAAMRRIGRARGEALVGLSPRAKTVSSNVASGAATLRDTSVPASARRSLQSQPPASSQAQSKTPR